MSLVLAIIGWTVFGGAILAALVLNLVGLFGNWVLLVVFSVAGLLTGFEHFGGWTLGILLGLAVLGEILEAISSAVGTARYGGGKGAMTASLAGCLLGALAGTAVLPLVGTLIGACLGAFAAAALYEYLMMDKSLDSALHVGFGAALGRVAGLFLKTFVGFAMLLVAALNF